MLYFLRFLENCAETIKLDISEKITLFKFYMTLKPGFAFIYKVNHFASKTLVNGGGADCADLI